MHVAGMETVHMSSFNISRAESKQGEEEKEQKAKPQEGRRVGTARYGWTPLKVEKWTRLWMDTRATVFLDIPPNFTHKQKIRVSR